MQENLPLASSEMSDPVFVNVPYDKEFEHLYLAYIVGLVALGLSPRPAIALSDDKTRFNKIVGLIDECSYSIHDLSRVQPSQENGLPRFNMPLELGMALYRAYKFPDEHRVYIFEEENYRLQKSTSDLNAFDVQIHNGTPKGVMVQLRNTFVRESSESTVPEMLEVLRALKKVLPKLKKCRYQICIWQSGYSKHNHFGRKHLSQSASLKQVM